MAAIIAWKADLPEKLASIIQKHPNKSMQLWVMDETRFGQKGYLSRIWSPKGTRPPIIKQNKFESAYITTAVNPMSGHSCSIVTSCMDTYVMNAFFYELAAKKKPDQLFVVILDQASWHRSKKLIVPEGIELLLLPPYSPELNPVENLWQYVKANYLSARVYKDMEEIIKIGCRAMKALSPARIKSICYRDYFNQVRI